MLFKKNKPIIEQEPEFDYSAYQAEAQAYYDALFIKYEEEYKNDVAKFIDGLNDYVRKVHGFVKIGDTYIRNIDIDSIKINNNGCTPFRIDRRAYKVANGFFTHYCSYDYPSVMCSTAERQCKTSITIGTHTVWIPFGCEEQFIGKLLEVLAGDEI